MVNVDTDGNIIFELLEVGDIVRFMEKLPGEPSALGWNLRAEPRVKARIIQPYAPGTQRSGPSVEVKILEGKLKDDTWNWPIEYCRSENFYNKKVCRKPRKRSILRNLI